tara:strand:+ start:523 stop:1287 length:765 start_codon:yes stop_codon:yes gene_type:complete
MNIENIYCDYLNAVNKIKQTERNSESNVFHASAAGSCYRKQLYSYYKFKTEEFDINNANDRKSLKILRLGTIVHKDMEEALIKYQDENANKKIYSEVKIEISSLNIVGTFDAGEMIEKGDLKHFNLYDLKTVAAYKWQKMFGLKKNREPNADSNYKLQLGTYALGIKEKFKPDKINMFLVYYNKNTSIMKERIVSNEWINKALEYWSELNELLEEFGKSFEDELEPEIYEGVPFENWECNYCQFSDICPSNLSK